MKYLKIEYLPEDEPYIEMVYKIAHKYGENTRCSFEDYVSVGLMALHKARASYDDKQDVKFQTYAYRLIETAIMKEWQSNANELSCSPYHVKNTEGAKEEVDKQNATVISVHQDIGNGEGGPLTIQNSISTSGINSQAHSMPSGDLSPVEAAEKEEIMRKVDLILDGLDKDDRDIVIRRIFQGETFQYIADVKGMSWRAVNYKFMKIKDELKVKFESAGLDIYS